MKHPNPHTMSTSNPSSAPCRKTLFKVYSGKLPYSQNTVEGCALCHAQRAPGDKPLPLCSGCRSVRFCVRYLWQPRFTSDRLTIPFHRAESTRLNSGRSIKTSANNRLKRTKSWISFGKGHNIYAGCLRSRNGRLSWKTGLRCIDTVSRRHWHLRSIPLNDASISKRGLLTSFLTTASRAVGIPRPPTLCDLSAFQPNPAAPPHSLSFGKW